MITFNHVLIELMRRVNQMKVDDRNNENRPFRSNLVENVRLNVNDLMKKRQEEKRVDKKTNILIFSGVAAVAAVVLVILSL